MMLKVQEFLRKNHSLEDLEKYYGIKSRVYPDRVVLNYGMIDSKKHKFNPIVQECRALILSLPGFEVLSRAFDRFFNYGEDPRSNEFPIEQSRCYEKVDGSLMSLYHDGNRWCVATRGMAFAEGNTMYSGDKTFHGLFMMASGLKTLDSFNGDKDLTYIFELVSPYSRVVKPYLNTLIYFLAARNKVTGEYVGRDVTWEIIDDLTVNGMNISQPCSWTFQSFEECMVSLRDLPTFDEGYVCYAENLNWRIKVKSPAYLALAHLRNNGVVSEKRIIEMILNGDDKEYLLSFPEDKGLIVPYQTAIALMYSEAQEMHEIYGDLPRKELAKVIVGHRTAHLVFGLVDGRTIEEMVDNATSASRVKMVKGFLK